MKITREIDLSEFRCFDCGRYWAVETGVARICPVCAGKTVESANARVAEAERSIRAYKANLTRRKGKKS